MGNFRARTTVLALAGVAGLLLTSTLGIGSAVADPPGSNGTIKVDGEEFGSHPGNEPHVGCMFEVDFYGYDEGDLVADVTFSAMAPTRSTSESQVLATDQVFVGEDDSSGGASESGLDASAMFELTFADVTPHPVQGYHVDVTVTVDGEVKHKVMWISDCQPPIGDPTIPF